MKELACDLHFHGPYSAGVSKNMQIPVLAEQAKLKGLDVLCTADILNAKWFGHVKKELVEEENGAFKSREFGTHFIIGTEVQCSARIHHLIYFPDLSSAENMKKSMQGKAIFDSWGCGRPVIRLSAEEIAEKAVDAGAIIGPAHAFTPYFSVYAHSDSAAKAYEGMAKKISFIELGLSADTYYADLIEENHNYAFLTNSDSHSPWPHRLGREFNRIKMAKPDYKSLKKALESREEGAISLNVGLDPREGKYHLTACNGCYRKYPFDEAVKLNWKCGKCHGQIKKGVRDRINELADFEKETHPKFRPDYLHIMPLAEIIQGSLGIKNVLSRKVQGLWREFIDVFKSEAAILVDTPIIELAEVDKGVAKKIEAFRQGYVLYIPGGGGIYGKPIICDSKEDMDRKALELKNQIEGKDEERFQKTLGQF